MLHSYCRVLRSYQALEQPLVVIDRLTIFAASASASAKTAPRTARCPALPQQNRNKRFYALQMSAGLRIGALMKLRRSE